jgi:hypothetical protein
MAGSLVWSGLYGFWSFFFLHFGLHHVPFSIIIQKRGWDGGRYHSCPDTLTVGYLGFFLYIYICLYMSLFARSPSLCPASFSLGSLVFLFITCGQRGRGKECVDTVVCVPSRAGKET